MWQGWTFSKLDDIGFYIYNIKQIFRLVYLHWLVNTKLHMCNDLEVQMFHNVVMFCGAVNCKSHSRNSTVENNDVSVIVIGVQGKSPAWEALSCVREHCGRMKLCVCFTV